MKPLISALLACDIPKLHDDLWVFPGRAVQYFLLWASIISLWLDFAAAVQVALTLSEEAFFLLGVGGTRE
jgi:uncharacterized integral membrane protein